MLHARADGEGGAPRHAQDARLRALPARARTARPAATPLHVAWFEPEHHIVEANAPFFARRFASMRWAILTPGALRATGTASELRFGPGARREDAPPPDAGEQLWLTYYQQHLQPRAAEARR